MGGQDLDEGDKVEIGKDPPVLTRENPPMNR